MPGTLKIENHTAKKLGFRGNLVTLIPGENDVDEDTFMGVWERDKTCKALYATRAFTIEKDDAPWAPKNAPKPLKRTPRELTGLKPVEITTPPVTVEVTTKNPVSTPTPQGAKVVPGTVPEATALIGKTDDVELLQTWYASETRAGVIPALEARLADLGALSGDG